MEKMTENTPQQNKNSSKSRNLFLQFNHRVAKDLDSLNPDIFEQCNLQTGEIETYHSKSGIFYIFISEEQLQKMTKYV